MSGKIQKPAYFLGSKELTAFRNGNFELHFLSMKLEKPPPDSNKFFGSGFMRQTPDGRFEFTMYSKKKTSDIEILDDIIENQSLSPGRLIPDSKFYTLTATDTSGRKWVTSVFNPDKKGSPSGTLLTGKFTEINCQGSLPKKTEKDNLCLEFIGEYQIPANTATKTDQTINGKRAAFSSSFNILKFTQNNIDFLFTQEAGSLRIEANTKQKNLLSNGIETKITESLQFVLGTPISWSILTTHFGKNGEIRLRALRKVSKGIKPPISLEIEYCEQFYNLFSSYLLYISNFSGDRPHPISANIRSMAQAGTVNIETLALVLSVAVESILKYTRAKSKISDEEKASIEELKIYLENWNGAEQLKTRARGLLSMLSKPSAKAVLRELVKNKVTTSKHKKAWEELRPKLAHGEMMGNSSLQEFLELTDRVLILFYHLVFHIISYKGKYTDYSIDEWPEIDYPIK
jgi:hypothetical protein